MGLSILLGKRIEWINKNDNHVNIIISKDLSYMIGQDIDYIVAISRISGDLKSVIGEVILSIYESHSFEGKGSFYHILTSGGEVTIYCTWGPEVLTKIMTKP